MNDDLPEIFDRLAAPKAPARLRGRVLSAVDRELVRRFRPRFERACELAAAACLLVGVGTTAWQWNSDSAWQRVAMPEAKPPAVSDAWYAESDGFGDERLAAFVNRRVARRTHSESAADAGREFEKLLAEITKVPHG